MSLRPVLLPSKICLRKRVGEGWECVSIGRVLRPWVQSPDEEREEKEEEEEEEEEMGRQPSIGQGARPGTDLSLPALTRYYHFDNALIWDF
jgi:hypothetical protein